jgi:hypothetical protein
MSIGFEWPRGARLAQEKSVPGATQSRRSSQCVCLDCFCVPAGTAPGAAEQSPRPTGVGAAIHWVGEHQTCQNKRADFAGRSALC